MLDHFVPSDSKRRLPILGDHLPVLPLSVARAYVDAYTSPNDIVLDPFCSGTSVIRAALESGRRVIASSFNPIVIAVIESALWPLDARAALTHLADARKGDLRLRDHITNLYVTRCPTCGEHVSAQAFIWDRETNAPLSKVVTCKTCGPSSGEVDSEDVAAAHKHEPRGLPFWLLHGKVLPRDHMDAERVTAALDAYTPRAIAALADIVLKFDGLSTTDRDALRAPLIALFDAASSLHPADESVSSSQPRPRPKPRSLRAPSTFVEYNTWFALEAALDMLPSNVEHMPRVPDVDTLLASDKAAVCLALNTSRELSKRLPQNSIDLLITQPPLPDIPLWTLSAVWSHWLWRKSDPVPAMLPLLAQRRTNWDWQWRATSSALRTLLPALRENASTLFSFNAEDTTSASTLDSVSLASVAAGTSLVQVMYDPFDGYRLHLQPQGLPPRDRDRLALAEDIGHIAVQAAIKTLRARSEPTVWPLLHATILKALAAEGLLSTVAALPADGPQPLTVLRESIEMALEANDKSLVQIEDQVWWLVNARRIEDALADRVEESALEIVRSKETWSEFDLLHEVYRGFRGDLTPERPLVAECVASYTEETDDGQVRLRTEDSATARTAEVKSITDDLMALGERLHYIVESRDRQIVWKDEDRIAYTMVISVSAETAPIWHLSKKADVAPVLVMPGSRATLMQYKLARDARLRAVFENDAWQFLKFSAVREMITHADMDRRAFSLALGLDPPLEQEQVQIPLL